MQVIMIDESSFRVGQLVTTRGAAEFLEPKDVQEALNRYTSCDWGDLDDEDKQMNDQAVILGDRIVAKYIIKGTAFYIITEADRSLTTILLPEEY